MDVNVRKKPMVYKQPFGSPKCWAYALASWLGVTEGRVPTPPEIVFESCKNFVDPRNGALNPKFVDRIFDSPFIRMGFKVVDGKDFRLSEARTLLSFGYIYAVLEEPGPEFMTGGVRFSHARVIYGATTDDTFAAGLYTIDPIKGEFYWKKTEIDNARLILGFAMEHLSDDESVGRRAGAPRQWIGKLGKVEVARFTPTE